MTSIWKSASYNLKEGRWEGDVSHIPKEELDKMEARIKTMKIPKEKGTIPILNTMPESFKITNSDEETE